MLELVSELRVKDAEAMLAGVLKLIATMSAGGSRPRYKELKSTSNAICVKCARARWETTALNVHGKVESGMHRCAPPSVRANETCGKRPRPDLHYPARYIQCILVN
jgi:hypothetical protein